MFSGIGGSEILLVLLVVLILFGSKRIPEFARAMGKATREVRKALNQIREEVDTAGTIEPPDGDPPRAG
ncbi:MAG: twin-arginine translocase TatA/TatE family subunit [bacterium]|jgi:TatA/E family protein of Tat protein translocase